MTGADVGADGESRVMHGGEVTARQPAVRSFGTPMSAPVEVAVVTATVLRPTLLRAVESVFQQDFPGHIHLLIGIDVALGDRALLEELCLRCPPHIHITVFDPGYSTSTRHGGPHTSWFGGSLQSVLTFMANAPAVAYLDDDDWWAPNHLSSLHAALQGRSWAFSLSWYVDPWTLEPLCIDGFESVGPDAGHYADDFGGFVRPQCLMLDKLRCQAVVHLWSAARFENGESSDRLVYGALRAHFPEWAATGLATAYCLVKPTDAMHPKRLAYLRSQGCDLSRFDRDDPFIAPRV